MSLNVLAPLTPLWAQESQNFWTEDVWKNPRRGFLFYGPHESQKKDKNTDRPLESLSTIEAIQAEVQARLNRAILTPNAETLASYLEINHFLLTKSETFAQTWERTLFNHPQFDATVQYPSANFAQVMVKDAKRETQQNALIALKDRWALAIVVQEGCTFCDAMAPVMAFIEETLQLEVMAIYQTVQPKAWPNARKDNGILARLIAESNTTIESTPAIFAVSKDGAVIRLATGAVSVEEIIKRLLMIVSERHNTNITGSA